MRLRNKAGAMLTAVLLTLPLSACGLLSAATVSDRYDDAYLEDLRETLLASDLVVDTQVGPGFYERTSSVPPKEATVDLVEGARLADLPELIEAVSALSEQYDEKVPALNLRELVETEFFVFEGRMDAQQTEELNAYILEVGWQRPQVYMSIERDDGAMLVSGEVESVSDLTEFQDGHASLPSFMNPDKLRQMIDVSDAKMVNEVWLGGKELTDELIEALQTIDDLDDLVQDGMPSPSISLSYASSSGTYVHRLKVTARSDDYNDLERDEIRVRAEEDGYAELCTDAGELLAAVPGLEASSSVDCRVNAVNLQL